MASNVGQRGKSAEAQMQKHLQHLDQTLLHFDWLRLPDARTAMGRGTAMPGDFEAFMPMSHLLLEVKEVAHDFRLPAKNVGQLPKMRKRTLAGGHCFLIVYHSTTKKWRRIPVMELEVKTTGSWDLSEYEQYDSVSQALSVELLGGLSG